MKKVLNIIKKVFIGIFLVAYLSVVIAISALLLSKNDYGVSAYKDMVLILIDEDNKSDKYPEGILAIVKEVEFKSIKAGDEVFVYRTNKDETVTPIVATIESTHFDADSPYVTLADNGGDYSESYIAGQLYKQVPTLGKVLTTLENKWIFFIVLIVPCFFILIYEIYLIIVYIKYGDDDEEEIPQNVQPQGAEQAKVDELMQQINSLKEQINNQGTPAAEPSVQPATPVASTEPLNQPQPTIEQVNIQPATPVTPVTPVAPVEPTPVVNPVENIETVDFTANNVSTSAQPVNNEPEFVVLDDDNK